MSDRLAEPARWDPRGWSRPALVDAGFLTLLTVIALAELSATFDGPRYLVIGTIAALLGIAGAGLARLGRWVVPATLLAAVLIFLLLGPVLALRGDQAAGALPGPAAWTELWSTLLHGWKQLLTTLPPVDGSGRLLVLPMLIGLLMGAGGQYLARATDRPVPALLVPGAGLAATILLGTGHGQRTTAFGLLFGCAALAWASIRGQRRTVRNRDGRTNRLVTAAVLLAVTAALVGLAGSYLPGAGSGAGRLVLRNSVHPPIDLSDYPSPLVGFRKYTPDAKELAQQVLFTEQGLPAGTPIRIATLDRYAGTAWTAGGSDGNADQFSRVGTRIATSARGSRVRFSVRIAPGYAQSVDSSVWLADAGSVTGIAFAGPNRTAHGDSVRYNLDTAAGLVTDRLKAGDSYDIEAVLPSQQLPASLAPFGAPTLDASVYSFVSRYALSWGGSSGDPWQRLLSIAKHLHDTGAYTDGGPGETSYLPGHSLGRLTQFLAAPQPAGDDEQYAASLALLANYLGLPARVVLGAIPEPDGTVKGIDVHAWIEVHAATGDWVALPSAMIVPDHDRTPIKQQQQQQQDDNSAVVPPPNSLRPPSSLEQFNQADSSSSRSRSVQPQRRFGPALPGWLSTLLWWLGVPILLVLLYVAAVLTAKAARRRLRRTRGSPGDRIINGWQELLDYARDLGEAVPPGRTRQESAALLPHYQLAPLAVSMDAATFGRAEIADFVASEQWESLGRVLREIGQRVGRRRRLLAALSLRSLLSRQA